jgi:hypothetical protein
MRRLPSEFPVALNVWPAAAVLVPSAVVELELAPALQMLRRLGVVEAAILAS